MVINLTSSKIRERIKSGTIRISIIGLGQVGLPQALHFVKEGACVIGVDTDAKRIELIRQGICPLATRELIELFSLFARGNNFKVTSDTAATVKDSRVHILCLPTPLGKDRVPDFSALADACEQVGQGLCQGSLVIIESSVYPGVTAGLVRSILEDKSGLAAGDDFGLAYCFERIDPGNTRHRIDNTPRVIGGIDEASQQAAQAVYGIVIKAPIIKARDCQTAELVKLVENIYRDVNIAFINEIALLCEKLGVDVLEVLEAASSKWSFMPHIPGTGVGGSCLPVNPYYLMQCAREVGVDLPLVRQARQVNESMPYHTVALVEEALHRLNIPLEQAKVCVLGLSYKADVDDLRGSPGGLIARELRQKGADVTAYDPLVTSDDGGVVSKASLEEAVRGVDCIVLATDHSIFKSLDLKLLDRLAGSRLAIVDGRHIFRPKEAADSGIKYIGVGRIEDSQLNIWDLKQKLSKEGAG